MKTNNNGMRWKNDFLDYFQLIDKKYSIKDISKFLKSRYNKKGTYYIIPKNDCIFLGLTVYGSSKKVRPSFLLGLIGENYSIKNDIPKTKFWSHNMNPKHVSIDDLK